MDQYIGRMLDGRYEILEIIGTGGMAVVYKARCHRLNRLVAIKVLKDEFARDEEFRRRFRAEGEAVAMLSHPNIVQVYDVSSSEYANFIVMELIDGISLKQYMEKRGSLNWKETLHFAMQIATGLEHAHSRGIVHRDIKPHNVMVLKNGSVKVMDFGIARVMSKSNTLTKEALGSVHYISPEQAKGSFTDNRSDLYSLSVVMYEMMTGRPPYDGESPVSVAIQHISGGAVFPSVLNPNIPKGLEQIILKGMSLELKDRYASATDMLRDMEEFRKNPEVVFSYEEPPRTARPIGTLQGRTTAADREVRRRTGVLPQKNGQPQPKRRTQDSTAELQRRKKAEEDRRKQRRSRTAAVAIVVCSTVALLAIAVFMIALFNGFTWNRDKDRVDVPYLVGSVYSDDVSVNNPDLLFDVQYEFSTQYSKGKIIRQTPNGGERVAKETKIFVVVSLGEEVQQKKMENLVGVTREEARSFLEGQGFFTIVREEVSYVYEPGVVFRTEPAAETLLVPGQTIKLWVSTGPALELEKMPHVVGMDLEIALQLLEGLGFKNVEVQETESTKTPGTVIYQSVQKGQEIDVTTEIILEVSKGKEETPPPTAEVTEPTVQLTQFVTFDLPIREEPYELTIYRGGVLVIQPMTVEPGTDSYTQALTGSGLVQYDIYINDVLYESKIVEFTEDGN